MNPSPSPISPWGEPSAARYPPPGSLRAPVPAPGTTAPGATVHPQSAIRGTPPGQTSSQAQQALEDYYRTAYCALLWTIAGEMVWDASEVEGVALSPVERRALLAETVWMLIEVTGLPVDLSLTDSLLSVEDDPPFSWTEVGAARECLWREFGDFIQAANRRRSRSQTHGGGNRQPNHSRGQGDVHTTTYGNSHPPV